MAGELAIEAGILPWKEGVAFGACLTMFNEWQVMRGTGATEHRQILDSVSDYILKFGDTKFTDKDKPDDKPKTDRAGWHTDRQGERIYLFTPAALKEAGGNYDIKRVLDALDGAGWIVEHDDGKRSKQTRLSGGTKPKLYWINPTEEETHA